MRAGVSACIIARNEAERIDACLSSLAWCDEIVLIDARSTDDTPARATAAGARVIVRDWPGYAAQREFAIRAATHDWVLCIDADERVSPALQAEIVALRATNFPDRAGWDVPRRTWYLGDWIRHGTWYPDYGLRLFDRRRGRWVEHPSYAIHERVELQGPRGRLQHDLLHYPFHSISDHLRTIDQYTTLMAEGLHRHDRRVHPSALVLRPLGAFVTFYLVRRGFLDGWRGLLLACLHAHYTCMKYAKLLVLARNSRQ